MQYGLWCHMSFSYCYTKIHWSDLQCEWLFYSDIICNIPHNIWKIGFTELCIPPKCWHKSWSLQSLKSPPISSKKFLNIRQLSGSCDRHRFSKPLIFTWRLKCDHWKQVLSVSCFLKGTSSLHSLWRDHLPNTQIWISIVNLWVVLLRKNDVSWKMWIAQFATQKLPKCFSSV